jgi:hypothetical protein
VHRFYDAEHAQRCWLILGRSAQIFQRFRSRFIGKASPVHFFWGSFDLAATRFSGRAAPTHPGGIPNMPDRVTRDAYSHEVSSCGFWPGGAIAPYPLSHAFEPEIARRARTAAPGTTARQNSAHDAGQGKAFQETLLAFLQILLRLPMAADRVRSKSRRRLNARCLLELRRHAITMPRCRGHDDRPVEFSFWRSAVRLS